MPFVNEFIPALDVEKYGVKAIDEKFVVGGTSARQWTANRQEDIFLRNVARGGGAESEIRNQTIWTLHWHGDLLMLRLDLLDATGSPGEPGWSHWKLIWLNGSNGLPEHLRQYKNQIIEDLKTALAAYQGAGAYSAAYSDYSITLEIGEECML
ncbi:MULTISPECIES: hypothetical protein [unclassified Lysobacter]|uniref:hypothetical protein n=1 Tax=unclassified Lysobacter TaxID=2635362 RepID=UPI001BE5EAAE|nr:MULTISPECIES: hypothetical protein [unclassified Lysobacter]MBT2745712.1 hypothetical protein [Lysobacter sp. ISL-42]MBT2749729.1 hypothetical protein [Lysobacter sp. ISL-50]MBT2777552.1 hypothetical protein [Lysobacter sp. ISL-54]MBT2782040.1 hypothetical protein [Lysobacter sp. ISL-52]